MASNYPTIDYEEFPDSAPFPRVPLPISTASNAMTITTDQLLAGVINHVITSDKSLTLPDADTLYADLSSHGFTTVGAAIDFTIITTAGFTTTVVPGSGGSSLGGVDVTDGALFRIIMTNIDSGSESYTLVRLSGGKPELNLCPSPFTTATNATSLIAVNIFRGVITHDITTNLSLTLDTATNVLAAAGPTTQIGSYFDFTIITTAGFITTVVPGTGGTLMGSDTVDGSGRFRIQFTNVTSGTEAYLLIRLASDAPGTATIPAPVTVTAANPGLLTTADVLDKNVFYTATVNQTVTLPTAAGLVTVLGGNGIDIGTFTELTVVTTRGYILTIAAGTGGTLLGSARIEHSGTFRFIITNSGVGTEAYQVVRLDSGEPALKICGNPITTTPINKSPIASSDILSQVFVYDADQNNTAQLPAASTLLTAWTSSLGHPVSVGACLEFTAIATPGYKLTLGTIDPSVTAFGSMALDDSGTFRVIFTNVGVGTEAYSVVRLSGGDPNLQLCAQAVTTVTNGPMTAAQLVAGTITFAQNTDIITDFPSPSDVITELGNAGQAVGVGACVSFTVMSTNPYTVIFKPATSDVTLLGSGIISTSGTFKLIISSVGPDQYTVAREDEGTLRYPAIQSAIAGPAVTLTTSQLTGRLIRYTITQDDTLTLPDADDVLIALGGPDVGLGAVIMFHVQCTSQYRTTLVMGTGGTLVGDSSTAIIQQTATFILVMTNVTLTTEAYSVFRTTGDAIDYFKRVSISNLVLADANATPTAAQIVGPRVIDHSAITANRTITFPTAASIVAAMAGGKIVAGASFDFTVQSNSNYTSQVIAGTGGTLRGSGVCFQTGSFTLVIKNVTPASESYDLIRIDSGIQLTTGAPTTFTSYTDANQNPVTATHLLTGVLLQTTATADRTLTIDTAANLVSSASASVGTFIDFTVITTPQYRSTVAVSTGGTLRGSGIVLSSGRFRLIFTNVTGGTEAYQLIRQDHDGADFFVRTSSSITTVGDANSTLVASDLVNTRFFNQSTMTADRTLTVDTVANIVSQMGGVADGSHFEFTVITKQPYRSTVVAGAGGTLYGSGIVKNTGSFLVILTTNKTAYNLVRLDSDIVNYDRTTTAITAVSGSSITGANLVAARIVEHTPLSADTNNNLSLPDTASIATALGVAQAGATFETTFVTDPTARTQIVPHAEGTLYGSSVVTGTGTFRFVLTGASSYDVIRLNSETNTTQAPTASSSASFSPTVDNLRTGLINHTAAVAGNTELINLPSAADIVTNAGAIPNAIVGTSIDFIVAAVSGPKRVVVGTGGTLITGHNDIVSHGSSGVFRVRVTNAGSGTEAYDLLRIGAGDSPVKLTTAPAAAQASTVTPITVAEIQSGVIRYSSGGANSITLPTATLLNTATYNGSSQQHVVTGAIFDFSIINLAGGTITLVAGTGGTLDATSTVTIADTTSGLFRIRMTSSSAYNVYRLA